MNPTKSPHGTNSRYSRGCKCPLCRQAHATYKLNRKHGRPQPVHITHPPVPIGPLLDVCAHLQGVHIDQLDRRTTAAQLGIRYETLSRWLKNGHLPEPSADHVATRLGWHPAAIWGLPWYMGLAA